MARKQPNPVDVHVGGRVRLRRLLIGMSQEKLGERLGLTFQQVQKYEKGTNRIGASRLYQIAQILGVPVQFFFESLEGEGAAVAGMAEGDQSPYVLDFVSSSEGLQLNRAFAEITDASVRRSVVELVRSLAKASSPTEG